jgi:hypothetical protein
VLGEGGRTVGVSRQRGEGGREERRAPAAVAARRAEAGGLGLEDEDAELRVRLREVVGGPQPGEAGPDDRDVGVGVAVERCAGGPVGVDGVVPEREALVVGVGTDGLGVQRTPQE